MKKRFLAAAAVSLMLGSGFSLAYMNDTVSVVNEFSFVGEKGLDAVLTEPSWDPQSAVDVLPSAHIPKDPCVTNTSSADLDELVALKMEFVYAKDHPDETKRGQILSDEDMKHVTDVFEIDYNADSLGDWVRFDGEDAGDTVQHFYYNSVLKRNLPAEGDVTVPLFTELYADAACGNETFSYIQDMAGFDIRISGCVLQQMEGEQYFGLNSAKEAYEAGLFVFTQFENTGNSTVEAE